MDLNHTWWRLGWPSSSFVPMLHGTGIVRQCPTNSFKPNADRCSSFMGACKMFSNFCKWSHVGIAFSKQKRNPISRNSFSRNHGSGNWPLWRLNHPFSTSMIMGERLQTKKSDLLLMQICAGSRLWHFIANSAPFAGLLGMNIHGASRVKICLVDGVRSSYLQMVEVAF